MGKGKEECDGLTVRRSGRKRKLKRDDDFDYDHFFDYDHQEDRAVNYEPIPQVKPTRTSTPEVYFETSYDSAEYQKEQEPKIQKPRKKTKLDVTTLKPEEIIDSHCERLELRLKKVAYSYLESLTPPVPKTIMPRGTDYPSSESDDVAVKTVLNNVLRAISLLH